MKACILALLATAQAVSLSGADKPAVARVYNENNEPIKSTFARSNKDILDNYIPE